MTKCLTLLLTSFAFAQLAQAAVHVGQVPIQNEFAQVQSNGLSGKLIAGASNVAVMNRGTSIYTYDSTTQRTGADIAIPTYGKNDSHLRTQAPKVEIHLQPKGSLFLMVTEREFLIYDRITGALISRLETDIDQSFLARGNNPTWSSNGKYLAFPAKQNRQLKVFDAKTLRTHLVAANLVFEIIGHSWSPDETRLYMLEGIDDAFTIDIRDGNIFSKPTAINKS